MFTNRGAGKSLIFYPDVNYSGKGVSIAHGETNTLSASVNDWSYKSVGLLSMYSYIWSKVDPSVPGTSYLGHIESSVSADIADLTKLYPDSSQFPLQYLGVDPDIAILVWLTIDAKQTAPDALAATAIVGGTSQSVTTLTLPGGKGALGFIAVTGESATMVNCQYGSYDDVTGLVAWSGNATLFLAYQDGKVTLTDDGNFPVGWIFSAPELQSDGSWCVALNSGSSSLTLYENANFAGTTKTLILDDSTLLRDALSSWNWRSAKPGSEHLLSHTLIGDRTSFDFRTYRDSYDVADVADFSDNYPTLLSSSSVLGTVLGDNDVVVRIALQPVERGLNVVATGTQLWPLLTDTASVTNGIQSVDGVLAVFNKIQSVSGIPLNVGTLNPDSGIVTWQVSTSLLAHWNNSLNIPEVTLAQDAPDGWRLSALQSTGNPGEYSAVLSGITFPSNSISLSADPAEIVNDGVSQSVITAKVIDSSNQPVANVTVTWSSSAGTITPLTSLTQADGTTFTTLTDDGTPGTATVTAMIPGNSAQVTVTVTDNSTGNVIVSLTSDTTVIENNGTDTAKLLAIVQDSSGHVVEGIAVFWETTLGTLNHSEQDTDSSGQSHAKLTATGVTGKAKVTASLDNGSTMSTKITVEDMESVNMYCSTGAPLNSGALAAVQPTNKVALYGTPLTTVQLSVTGNAKFKSSNTSSVSISLDATGYGLDEVYDTLTETVTVSMTVSGTVVSRTMTFTDISDTGAIYVNNQTPADNKTPGTFYWWDYIKAGVKTVQLTVNGSAHFLDGSKSGSFPLTSSGGAVAVDIFDTSAETVSATLTPDSPYYSQSTENITFVAYQPVQK